MGTPKITRKRTWGGLTADEWLALREFIGRLRHRYGADLLAVILFGSKARGDSGPDSDVDLLLIVRLPESERWARWQTILAIADEVGRRHGVTLSPVIGATASFYHLRRHRLLLYRNVERDGVTLWTNRLSRCCSC